MYDRGPGLCDMCELGKLRKEGWGWSVHMGEHERKREKGTLACGGWGVKKGGRERKNYSSSTFAISNFKPS